ncbi:MAG: hypothetical protein EOM12_03475 [Verrucomicrobiae bacterium]|nr:hypothetical protein [Verrucomicrobiae bacterium]
MNEIEERLNKIHKRQVARVLDHLKTTGQLTPDLEASIKRSYGFTFNDVKSIITHGHDKDSDEARISTGK